MTDYYVNLGDKVKDLVSGFEGIVTAKHLYLYGCSRISIQPVVNDKGELPEYQTFDEPQLEVLEKLVINVNRGEMMEVKDAGGPEKYMPKKRASE